MYVHVCMYVYVYIHIYLYTCMHIHICMYVCMCIYTYTYIYIYIYTYIYIYIHVYVYIHMYISKLRAWGLGQKIIEFSLLFKVNFKNNPSTSSRIHRVESSNTLQCNTLQHTATHGNTLQHTATHCDKLHVKQNSSSPIEGLGVMV